MAEHRVGTVSNYYTRIGVAAIDLEDTLAVGDNIAIRGATTDFSQTVASMQIDRAAVEQAGNGQAVGVKVDQTVRAKDVVYRVTD